jgi:hypothetical protein
MFLRFTLIAASLAAWSRAQPPPAEESINAKLRFVWASPSAAPDLVILKPGKPPQLTPIVPARLGFGPVQDYRGPRTLRLYHPAIGEAAPALAGEAPIPPGGSEWIVLLTPRPDLPGNVTVAFIAENTKTFPPDSFLIVNLTSAIIGGRFGGKEFVLQPGLNTPLAVPPRADPPLSLQLAVRYKQRVVPLIDSPMILAPGTRSLFLVGPPPRAGSLNILTFFVKDPSISPPAEKPQQ